MVKTTTLPLPLSSCASRLSAGEAGLVVIGADEKQPLAGGRVRVDRDHRNAGGHGLVDAVFEQSRDRSRPAKCQLLFSAPPDPARRAPPWGRNSAARMKSERTFICAAGVRKPCIPRPSNKATCRFAETKTKNSSESCADTATQKQSQQDCDGGGAENLARDGASHPPYQAL